MSLGARNFLKKVCLYTGFEVTKNCLDTKLIEDMEQNLSQSFSYFENLFDEVTALKRPEFCGAQLTGLTEARNELAFTELRLYGFPSSDFSQWLLRKKRFNMVDSSAGSMFSSATGSFSLLPLR